MFKLNKGSSLVILIISIVVAVLIILSVGGVILWKYLQKSEKESRDRDKDEVEVEVEDCGVSRAFLSDFKGPTDINFEEDEAMICMGQNMQDRCKESEAVVKLSGRDFTYEISGTKKSNCKIKVGYFDPEEKTTSYVECSVLKLASFVEEEKPGFEERLSGTPEDYAGFLFVAALFIGSDPETLAEAGCVTNVPEDYSTYDARIKSDLAQLRSMAELHYVSNDDSYTGFTAPDLVPPECSESDSYIVQISPDGQSYLAYAKLCDEDVFWCADSAGFFEEVTDNNIPYNIYTCP